MRLCSFILFALATASAFAIGGGEPPTDAQGPASQSDVILLVVYVLLALVFSFMCSVAEAVLLSITPSYIAGIQDEKPKLADLLKRLKQDNVDQSLAAILTLNTVAHTVGAIGSGSKATAVFGSAWFGVFSAVMTLLILFLSEIIPKTLGAVHWRKLARPTAAFVRALILLLFPLIWLSERLTKLLASGHSHHAFNREEFVAMASVGKEAGQIDEHESRILRNLFQFESLTAKDVMTPRTVLQSFQEDMTVQQALDERPNIPFSRLPVYGDSLDEVTGFVLKGEMLLAAARGQGDRPLSSIRRDMTTVPRSMRLAKLLELLLKERQHIALVVGEYGGTDGLVSLEDVVETLLGIEIVDELDSVEDMQALARKKWEHRAEAFGIAIKDGEGEEP